MKVAIAALVCLGCSKRSRVQEVTSAIEGKIHRSIEAGQPISSWILGLGTPSLVSKAEEFDAFYYWEEFGIGALCHPNYESQFRYLKPNDWKVTTVYLAVQTNITINLPGSMAETSLRARRILFSEAELATASQGRLEVELAKDGVLQMVGFTVGDFMAKFD